MWVAVTAYGCGGYSSLTFFATIPSFLFTTVFYLTSDKTLKARSLFSIDSLLSLVGILILGLLLIKNLNDVLFVGPEAILPRHSSQIKSVSH